MIGTHYRTNYAGEFVVLGTVLVNGKYEEEREWVANSITNNSHNGVAVILGNGMSRSSQNLNLLAAHKRQRPSLRLQTYGCNALVRDFAPDFLVVNTDCIIPEVEQHLDRGKTTVLTTSEIILKYPGKFHLIPNNLNWNAGAIATFLACFDGHRKVYLAGFDGQGGEQNNNIYAGTPCYDSQDSPITSDKWEQTMYKIFRSYPDVDFVRVRPAGITPKSWSSCLNFRQITQREFVLEVDL